jgi:hypothetical protein
MSTFLADMRQIFCRLVLLLNVVAQGGRIAFRMRFGRIGLEIAEMTHEMTIWVPLVFDLFLLCRRGVEHGVLRPWGDPWRSIFWRRAFA